MQTLTSPISATSVMWMEFFVMQLKVILVGSSFSRFRYFADSDKCIIWRIIMPWITEHVMIAGAGISHETWQELRQYNFEAVVNMRAEYQDTFIAPLPKAYLWIPIEDHTNPLPEQL